MRVFVGRGAGGGKLLKKIGYGVDCEASDCCLATSGCAPIYPMVSITRPFKTYRGSGLWLTGTTSSTIALSLASSNS